VLRRDAFVLVHRALLDTGQPPENMLDWTFLGDVSRVYRTSGNLVKLLDSVLADAGPRMLKSLNDCKRSLIEYIDSQKPSGFMDAALSARLLPFLRASPALGLHLMTGSDLLDSITASYPTLPLAVQSKLLVLTYLGLRTLMQEGKPNHSLLFDHLYSLKSSTDFNKEGDPEQHSLLSDLVTNTPLITKMRNEITGLNATRARTLIVSLEKFQRAKSSRPKKLITRRINRGKGRANDEHERGKSASVHVHRMSLVTQVQDLFPELGSAFIVKLFDEYNDDVEQVTAHLLDDSLPLHLQTVDRTENLDSIPQQPTNDLVPNLIPHSTPPPSTPTYQRRNIFDNDDFDRLAVDASRLHMGRKNKSATADSLLADRTNHTAAKAAILSALAAFDSDDDERDDTYDLADVGGTVGSAAPGGSEEADAIADDQNEETLFGTFSVSPEVFERDSGTRRGKARQALKSQTGMTDEAIEGWAVMVRRDPRRLRKLEAKYAMLGGQQKELQSTAWRGNAAGSATEDSEASGGEGGRGGFRARGRGRGFGGRGRGGNVAGSADEKGTQVSRQRKEANKGSRANHNRRDQRAKKMARGGFPG